MRVMIVLTKLTGVNMPSDLKLIDQINELTEENENLKKQLKRATNELDELKVYVYWYLKINEETPEKK